MRVDGSHAFAEASGHSDLAQLGVCCVDVRVDDRRIPEWLSATKLDLMLRRSEAQPYLLLGLSATATQPPFKLIH